ncbi:MAG: hypothetical protein QUV07_12095 [Cyanobium sp. CZS 25K]|nr:hypothetical protein [Cyanobium sp. CZS25K]
MITELNHDEPEEVLLDSFCRQLLQDLEGCDCLILSHEYLFQNPNAVMSICVAARHLADQITIIGYSRRQSSFLESAYSQWWFRSPDRINEVNKSLAKLGLDSVLFTGLERQFIASIENDFYSARQLSGYSILDWNGSYDHIYQRVHELGVILKCGVLPNKQPYEPLIQDFCLKADLILHCGMTDASIEIANESYDHNVIEAINTAIILGYEVIGPHDNNEIVQLLSSKMTNSRKSTSVFLSDLKSYVDAYYWESNQDLCERYGIDQAYFLPTEMLSKQRVIDIIYHEQQRRSLHKTTIVEGYRILSAKMLELCINLAKSN